MEPITAKLKEMEMGIESTDSMRVYYGIGSVNIRFPYPDSNRFAAAMTVLLASLCEKVQ